MNRRSGPSGRTLTDSERAANGRERLQLRPRIGTLAMLRALADRWECSPGDAVECAIREALERT